MQIRFYSSSLSFNCKYVNSSNISFADVVLATSSTRYDFLASAVNDVLGLTPKYRYLRFDWYKARDVVILRFYV